MLLLTAIPVPCNASNPPRPMIPLSKPADREDRLLHDSEIDPLFGTVLSEGSEVLPDKADRLAYLKHTERRRKGRLKNSLVKPWEVTMIGHWLARWFDCFASPGLIGAPLATVYRSAWFDWFAWVETACEPIADGGMTLYFRPEHGAPVELTLELDTRQRVRGIRLTIAAAFLTGRNRPFALDALKSALAVLGRGHGAPVSLESLATHLEVAMGAPVSPSPPSTEVATALAVVAGQWAHWQTEGRRFAVSLDRDDQGIMLSAH